MLRARRVFRVRRAAIQSRTRQVSRHTQLPGTGNQTKADSRNRAHHETSGVRLGYNSTTCSLGGPVAHVCVPWAKQQRLVAEQARIEVQLQPVASRAALRLFRDKAAAGEGGPCLCRLRTCERGDRSVLRNEVDSGNRQTPADRPFQPARVPTVCQSAATVRLRQQHRTHIQSLHNHPLEPYWS